MIVYIKNNKGGVGKSSISRNLAHGFALKGLKIALISGDDQNDSLVLLGKEFLGGNGIKYLSQTGEDVKIKVRENLDYFPLETNQIGVSLIPRVKEALKKLEEEYHLLVIDGAPSKNDTLSKIALEISDQIIIPVDLDGLSIKAIKRLQEDLDIQRVSCVIPNKFRNTKGDRLIYTALERFFEDTHVYLTSPLPYTTFEKNLGFRGKSLYDSRSKKTLESRGVYDEIMDVIMSW